MKETIKQLPLSERPYERLEELGAQALSDAELLAVILRTGSMNQNSVQLAHQILKKDDSHKNLTGLMYLSREQLMEIPGIGRVKSLQLMAIAELASVTISSVFFLRIYREKIKPLPSTEATL